MTDIVAELAERSKALSLEERAQLVDLLPVSMQELSSPEAHAAWDAEIDRRLAEYDRGEILAIPATEVFAKARQIAS